MRCAGSLLVGRSLSDHRFAGDERRAFVGDRFVDRPPDIVEIVAVAANYMPSGRFVTRLDVFTGRKVGRPVDGDVVVVPEHRQTAQLEVPGKADRFVIDAFHQATVTGNHPSAMIDDLVTKRRIEMTFGHGHSDGHRQALPQRAGRAFHAVEEEVFRMPGARAADLPKIADVFHRRTFVSRQMKKRIDQHRTVSGRQHEAVPIGPAGGLGIML